MDLITIMIIYKPRTISIYPTELSDKDFVIQFWMGNQTAKKHHDLAKQYQGKGNFDKANEHYQKMIKAFPTWARGYEMYSQFLISHNRFEQADANYKQALKINPTVPSYNYKYASFLRKRGSNLWAIYYYQQALKYEQKNAHTHHKLALALKDEGRRKDAEQHFQRAIQIDNKDTGIKNNYALLLQEMGKNQQASQQYEESLKVNSEKESTHYNYAIHLKNIHEFQQAELHYQKVIELNPKSTDVYVNYALLCQQQGQIEKAQRKYLYALQLDEKMILARCNYAEMLNRIGRAKEAAENYSIILKMDPTHSGSAFNLAVMFKGKGESGRIEAQKLYKRALIADKDNPLFLCSQAQNLYCLNHKQKAFKNLEIVESMISSYSRQQILTKYGINEQNYSFMTEVLNQFSRFSRMEAIEQKMERKDQQLMQEYEKDFFSVIEPVDDQKTNPRQTLIKFEENFEQRIKELQEKYCLLLQQNSELTQKLSQVEEKLMWEERFDNRLRKLDQEGHHQIANFCRKLCWMLCSSIQSYRAVGVGAVTGGKNQIKSEAGQFIENVGRLCGVGVSLPLIGSICQLVARFAEKMVEMDEQLCVKKINEITTNLYTERKLLRAVTESIDELLDDKIFIFSFSSEKADSWKQTLSKIFSKFRSEAMQLMTGIQTKDDEGTALLYCTEIMTMMLTLTGTPKNPILLATNKVLEMKRK